MKEGGVDSSDDEDYLVDNRIGGGPESSLLLEYSHSGVALIGNQILNRPFTKLGALEPNNLSPWNPDWSFLNRKRRCSDSNDSTRKHNPLHHSVLPKRIDAKELEIRRSYMEGEGLVNQQKGHNITIVRPHIIEPELTNFEMLSTVARQ
jgi:hypothetical protein